MRLESRKKKEHYTGGTNLGFHSEQPPEYASSSVILHVKILDRQNEINSPLITARVLTIVPVPGRLRKSQGPQ